MHGFVANTDYEWVAQLADLQPAPSEVSFWRAGSERFRALKPGEPFLFKLKAPHRGIAGFGFFSHFSVLPLPVAWAITGRASGVTSEDEMRDRLLTMRSRAGLKGPRRGVLPVGCILINHPFFFEDNARVKTPVDFTSQVGQGKRYDLSRGEGKRLWTECLARIEHQGRDLVADGLAKIPRTRPGESRRHVGYGAPTIAIPRLGELSFRVAVIDAYGRRCAVTGETALPALDGVRIRHFGDARTFSVDNGIALRSDLARLFDAGWVTVTPDHRFRVGKELRERDPDGYARLHDTVITVPRRKRDQPLAESLWWHSEERFMG